jgi:protein arginine kinase activator
MKCQYCENPATIHITELTGGKPEELHLCEQHAREYLTQNGSDETATGNLAGALAQQLASAGSQEELARLDQRVCPVCGITFYEFRHQGRLGCPYDYVAFERELTPLLLNIHGETEHKGKRPGRGPSDSTRFSQLIRLRREMQEAIEAEHYERASELRDQIRHIQEEARSLLERAPEPPQAARKRKPPAKGKPDEVE